MSPMFTFGYTMLWLLAVVQTAVILRLLRAVRILQRDVKPRVVQGPRPGTPLPPFEVTRLADGASFRSDDLLGTPAVLAIVTPTCKSCKSAVAALRVTARDSGRRLVLACLAPDHGCRAYAGADPDDPTVLCDPRAQTLRSLRITSLPYAVALDADGTVTATGGAVTNDGTWAFAERARHTATEPTGNGTRAALQTEERR